MAGGMEQEGGHLTGNLATHKQVMENQAVSARGKEGNLAVCLAASEGGMEGLKNQGDKMMASSLQEEG